MPAARLRHLEKTLFFLQVARLEAVQAGCVTLLFVAANTMKHRAKQQRSFFFSFSS